MVQFLLDRNCPGLETVVTMGERRWNIYQIAKYFGAPESVRNVLARAVRAIEVEDGASIDGNDLGKVGHKKDWSCDVCECCVRHKGLVHEHDDFEEVGTEFDEVTSNGDDDVEID
ncbi:hypothetical protein NHQ30_007117 [Ciborinia camelliae]|nr:hypothetical protein NHQ30_007117 [Ciborinia camelliae]